MIIYKITNNVNGKIYIGQTTKTSEQRLLKHWSEAKTPNRPNNYFHNALLKYGIENFSIEVIDEATSIDELNIKEEYWINTLHSTDKSIGYNLMSGGKSGKKSDDTKELLRQRKLDNWKDEELVPKMLDGLRKGTEVWIQKCIDNRIEFTCPICGKKEMLPPWEAKTKQFCSLKCSSSVWGKQNFQKASAAKIESTRKRNELIKIDTMQWVEDNVDLIMNCPANKISNTLAELSDLISQKYDINDWRSIGIAICGKASKKELLQYLKSECEKVRCSGLK